jgi:hypothetical protein
MNIPRPVGLPPDPELSAARRRLAGLIGRLLARQWLRDQRRSDTGLPLRATRPAIETLRLPADGG